jgi:hypothetical protein
MSDSELEQLRRVRTGSQITSFAAEQQQAGPA